MSLFLGKNPYRPGVGTLPLHLAGREAEIRDFRAVLRAAPEIPANMRLTGLRGVGKTVLLREFANVADQAEWATATLELEPRHNTEGMLLKAVAGVAKRTQESLSKSAWVRARLGAAVGAVRSIGVKFEDITLTFDQGGPHGIDLSRTLFETTELALEKGRDGFVLLLDEAQVLRDDTHRDGEHPLSMLIAAVSALQKAEVPIGLVLCGLPTLTGNLLHARTYTERMFRGEHIGSLAAGAATDAFVRPLTDTAVEAEPALVDTVLRTVEGYPYFIQLWGAELWDAAEDARRSRFDLELLHAVEPHIYRRLDRDFYEPRVHTLTPAEQDLLVSAARCGYPPLRVADLNGVTKKQPGNVNVLLGRLVEAGVLYRIRKGQYEYTAPRFHEYLQRRAEAEDTY
ncbi:MAG TPA: ATP-binding protein [Mycobacteriales bacterium]|jgi:hypothetical protein|nr:ATP-binding protein [Mycobacteriales bacterium]